MISADVIVDLQYGDCAKGKVTHHLCKERNYTHVLRYNGGCNAGHTIYHEGVKFVTHHIPAGVFFGIKSIIGPGCVVNPQKLAEEVAQLEEGGIDIKDQLFIAKNTHLITEAHTKQDGIDSHIGTTKRGNGPAYSDKYARVGIRAEDSLELEPYLIDLLDELHSSKEVRVLCEGAQGFGLDIDWGDYPFVTSSHCTTAGALLNGIPYHAVNEVWGVAKIYETYVGAKDFEPDDPVFEKIRQVGDEYGATTGRSRQCNWLDLKLLKRAIIVNQPTHIVISKMDVLREVGTWKLINEGQVVDLKTEGSMKNYLLKFFAKYNIDSEKVFFSEHKDRI